MIKMNLEDLMKLVATECLSDTINEECRYNIYRVMVMNILIAIANHKSG
jgi:hypothetical protein